MRENIYARTVDLRRQTFVLLRVVDLREGGAVDDDIRPRFADRIGNGNAVGDVELALRQGHDLLAAHLQRGANVVADHPARSGDEPAKRHGYLSVQSFRRSSFLRSTVR